MDTTQLYIIFVVVGMLMMGAELFIPGGVLGVIGAGSLMLAVVLGFVAFGFQNGVISAVAIFVFLALSLAFWMNVIPKTRLGKTLMLSDSMAGSSSFSHSSKDMVGKEGVALSVLAPSGVARFDGQRMDVMAESSLINEGAQIRIVKVVGNNLIVRAVES
jgi:membrane-bound serine protease (ClpP class)